MTHHRTARSGFTLVETMVAGSLLASMGLAAMLWLSGISDLWMTSGAQSEARLGAQRAMNRLVAELRSATRTSAGSPPNAAIPASPDNTGLTFYLPADLDTLDGNTTIVDATGEIEWDTDRPVQYVYVEAQRQLQRVSGGETTVLANGIPPTFNGEPGVAFEDAGMDPSLHQHEVRITLTIQQATPQGRVASATAVEIVKLRN
jgi:type II secretory pathway pseudopilin PulG